MIGYDDASPGPEPVGKPDRLPADLIDRAAQLALDEVPVIRDVMRFPDAVVTKMMLAAADPLIEHGRQQERKKWEARIESLADQEELANRSRIARLLRSLLTEEEK